MFTAPPLQIESSLTKQKMESEVKHNGNGAQRERSQWKGEMKAIVTDTRFWEQQLLLFYVENIHSNIQ